MDTASSKGFPLRCCHRESFAVAYTLGKALRLPAMCFRVLGLVLLASLASCFPSRESKTAGSIGCPPDEIKIGNENSSSGWSSRSETWTATCRGRNFICSENTLVVAGGNGASGVSQGLNCREELDSTAHPSQDGAVRNGTEGSKERSAAAEPPKAVAGFTFGAAPSAIQQSCEAAGHTWTSESPRVGTCSGPGVEIGFEAEVIVTFCHKKSCSVTLVHHPDGKWFSTITALKQKLVDKYGPPQVKAEPIPAECRKESTFVQCITESDLRVSVKWVWPGKRTMALIAGKPLDGDGTPAIRITYVSPQDAVQANTEAL